MTRRVVITGMGTVNPLGLTLAESWRNAVEGVSGIGPITQFEASDLNVQIAGEVKGFVPEKYLDAKDVRRRDRFQQMAAVAVREAMSQAAYQVMPKEALRVAVIVSSAVGGLNAIQETIATLRESGPRRINPFAITMFMPNGAAGQVGIDLGAKGPSFSIASACASGSDGIGQAAILIRAGIVDVAIAGGSEATVARTAMAAFDRMGALSRRGYDVAPSPFDLDRDGFVMGEGAAIMVLEALEHARERGAEILAEVIGYGATADAFHITAPAEGGAGGAAAIRLALADGGVEPGEVDYVNAHGTGTPLNDVAETQALKDTLGKHAYEIPVSSTKSMTGHMMGATGALEACFCVQAIQTGIVPPTIKLHHQDPACDLDYVANEAREHKVRVAMSNAFGFGGHNSVLVLRDFSG